MSILSSTNTGKLKIIQDELERVYPETNNAAFRIVELENYYKKYKVIFSAKTGAGGIITINGYHLNYNIDFENNPYVLFTFFKSPNDFECIDRMFDLKCWKFKFRYCNFSGERWLKKALKWYEHLEYSNLYVPRNFFVIFTKVPEKQYIDFVESIKDNGNNIFINRNSDNNEIDFNSPDVEEYIEKNYEKVEFSDYKFKEFSKNFI